MRRVLADLHVHTALSPCAADTMTPAAIVGRARELGLGMIAVCDHNTAGNVAAVASAAGGEPAVICGIEITTREEVHVVGLLPSVEAAIAAGAEVLATLPGRRDRTGEPMLSAASALDLEEAVALVRDNGGLAVAAHVDRPAYSVPGQLGFFPAEPVFDAVEFTIPGRQAPALGCDRPPVPAIASSDAHSPEEIGRRYSLLDVEAPAFGEIGLALKGKDGRRCRLA